MMHRRAFLAFALSSLVLAGAAGCHRAERCASCGMKIDPASHFTSWLVVSGKDVAFDTPRCAFDGWRGRFANAEAAKFREYYSQQIRDAKGLLFVPDSDVVGPMGPDLVPVERANAARFAREHNAGAPVSADDIRAKGVP
jgi:hypothetical protein